MACAFSGRLRRWMSLVDSPGKVGIFDLKLIVNSKAGRRFAAPLQRKKQWAKSLDCGHYDRCTSRLVCPGAAGLIVEDLHACGARDRLRGGRTHDCAKRDLRKQLDPALSAGGHVERVGIQIQ
jgi:hypothetical protein